MTTITPYLSFKGDCDAAFTLYAKALGGHINDRRPYAGSPMAAHVPPEHGDKIMHMSMQTGGHMLMGSDDMSPTINRPMIGASVAVGLADVDKAHAAFAVLAEGGTIKMPIQPTFWSPAFGMLVDRFGVNWLISSEPEQA